MTQDLASHMAAQFQSIVDNARAVSGTDYAALTVVDHEARLVRVVAISGLDSPLLRKALSLASKLVPGFDVLHLTHAVDANPIIVQATRYGRTQVASLPELTAGVVPQPLAALALRLMGWQQAVLCPATVDGQVHGVLAYLSSRGVGEREIVVMEAFARQVALSIKNAQLYQAEQERRAEAELLLEVSRHSAATLDLPECMRRTTRLAAQAVGADTAGIYLADAGGTVLRPMAAYHVPPDRLEDYSRYEIPLRGHPFVARAYASGEMVASANPAAEPDIDRHTLALFPCATVAFVPLLARGQPLGGFWLVWWQEPRDLDPRQRRLLEGVGRLAAVAIENARLHAAEKATREEYQRLVGDIEDGYFIAQDWRLAFVNRRLAELVGRPAAELVGAPFLDVVAPTAREEVAALYRQALADGTLAGRMETAALCQDGSSLPVEVTVHPTQYQGQPAFAVVVRDISERQRLEEQRAELTRKEAEVAALRDLSALRSRLIATISHELRTPLSLLQGFSELLLLQNHDGPRVREMAGLINEGAVRLAAVVDDILQYAELAGSQVHLNRRPVCLEPLLSRCVEEVSQLYPTHRFELLPGAGLPPVFADAELVRKVVAHLLANAAKFSAPGQVIQVVARRQEGFVAVEVADQGIGVPTQDLERIFEPLHRTARAHRDAVRGTGLGLAIVKEVVKLHGGEVWAHSDPGKGSIFTFTLPVAEETLANANPVC